jgi:hypothetical protein
MLTQRVDHANKNANQVIHKAKVTLPQCYIKKMAKGWQTHMGVEAILH